MRLMNEKSWFGGVGEYIRAAAQTSDVEADAKEFEQLDKLIEAREFEKIYQLCIKYGRIEKEVKPAGFVKQQRDSKSDPLKGFCQYVIGRLYEYINGDMKTAEEYYCCSASNGCFYAMLRYGEIMLGMENSEENRHDGISVIKECVLQGYPQAVVKYAQLLLDGAETKAQKNYVYELLKLADCYADTEKHYIDEHLLYYLLGKCSEEGIGTTKSEKAAMLAYKRSLQCYPPNEFYDNIGISMEICRKMIEKESAGDTVYDVLRQLSLLGHHDAAMLVVDTYLQTFDKKCEQVLEDVAKSVLYYEGFTNEEKGRVYWALGNLFVGEDDDKALSNLMKATSLKNLEAMVRMACCFASGSLGLAQDDDQAYKMLTQVTENAEANKEMLAETYGICAAIVRRNIEKKEWATAERMVDCYKKAMDLGHTESMTEIALLTLNEACDTGFTKEDIKRVVDDYMNSNMGDESDSAVMFNLAQIYSDPIFNVDADRILDILDDALIISDDDAEILDYKGNLLLKLEREEEYTLVWEYLSSISPEYVEAMKEESEFIKKMKALADEN